MISASPNPSASSPRLDRLAAFCLVSLIGLTVLVYWPGMTPSFSSDDYVHLSRNLHFDSLGQALGVFALPDGREYRPLVRLSLWLNAGMGSTALPFHWTNLLLHLLTVGLVFGLVRTLGAPAWPAMAGTALFALHPIHTTSVHFIMGRTDLLATVFYLSAVWAGVRAWKHQRPVLLIPATLLAGAALASKEVAVSLPAVMVLAGLAIRRPKSRSDLWLGLSYIAPVALLVLIYVVVRLDTLPDASAVEGYVQFSLERVVSNYAQWIFALLYPGDLYAARFLLETRPGVFMAVAGSVAVACAGLILAWVCPRRRALVSDPLLWLGMGWLVVTLLPMAGGNAHRWYLYLPSVGLSLILMAMCRNMDKGPWRRTAAGVLGAVLLVCAIETTRQSLIWQAQHEHSERFFEAFETAGLLEVDEIHLANVPFGYKSAFLFTYQSLEPALRQRYGTAPEIHFLSYMNIGDLSRVSAVPNNNGLEVSVPVTPHSFLLLPPARRRVSGPVTKEVDGWRVSVIKPGEGGHIGQLLITHEGPAAADPLYYYEDDGIKKHALP